jgi:hypothetical protein
MKNSLEKVKNIFLQNNCVLLEETYNSNRQPLKFRCFCGKKDTKNLATFNNNPKCRFCAEEIRRSQRTKSFDEIQNIFDSKGNKLLSTEYISRKKLEYICDCGKIDYKTLHKFIAGERCKECGLKKSANSRRISQDIVESFYKEAGCELLSEYFGDERPLTYRCKCGSIVTSNFHTFKKRKNCWTCGKKKTLLDLDIIYKFVEENNLSLISLHTYENTKEGKLLLRCNCGREYEKTWNYLKNKRSINACKECTFKQKSEKTSGVNHPFWNKDREKVEFRKLFARRMYSMISKCYQQFNLKKEIKSYEFLGYTHYDLGFHITNHPNYKNAIKNNDMHIDHIFPIKAFIDFRLCEKEHIKIINSLENLQPLNAFDNLSKNDKYDKEEFIKFLKSKGIYIDK